MSGGAGEAAQLKYRLVTNRAHCGSPSPEAGPGQVAWNRVETRTLVESHVGINDLSDYACMLAVHMTNY